MKSTPADQTILLADDAYDDAGDYDADNDDHPSDYVQCSECDGWKPQRVMHYDRQYGTIGICNACISRALSR